jgi:hypothetical protein
VLSCSVSAARYGIRGISDTRNRALMMLGRGLSQREEIRMLEKIRLWSSGRGCSELWCQMNLPLTNIFA